MVEKDALAEKIFALLKGNGLQIKIFDIDGNETTDPSTGRRFFVADPNLMVTIDEEGNSVEFGKGDSVGNSVDALQKNIRKLTDEFLMNSNIKVFGKSIQPRDYAYQAKMNKDTMMENNITFMPNDKVVASAGRFGIISGTVISTDSDTSTIKIKTKDNKVYSLHTSQCKKIPDKRSAMMENNMQPHNHHLLGEVLKAVRYLKNATAAYIADNLSHPVGLDEITPILNRLVTQGTIVAEPNPHGEIEYKVAVDEAVMESFSKMFGSARTSQQTLENVVIKVRHKVPVNEEVRGARTRQISAIFLECNGERFRFAHNSLSGARAMAQHMAHGGSFADKVGSHITESTGNLLKLQSFNRYVTTNKLINEDSSGIIETIKENIDTLRTELKKIAGVKTYETVKARLETFEREALSEDDTTQLKDLFTIRRFDEKFEEVLPIVKQLVQEKDTYHKRIEECAANPVLVRREAINTTPMFEFASENARLGFKLNELALRITENDELAGFVNKVGTKFCKEGIVNEFEKAVIKQILENIKISETPADAVKELKESVDLSTYFDKFDYRFM